MSARRPDQFVDPDDPAADRQRRFPTEEERDGEDRDNRDGAETDPAGDEGAEAAGDAGIPVSELDPTEQRPERGQRFESPTEDAAGTDADGGVDPGPDPVPEPGPAPGDIDRVPVSETDPTEGRPERGRRFEEQEIQPEADVTDAQIDRDPRRQPRDRPVTEPPSTPDPASGVTAVDPADARRSPGEVVVTAPEQRSPEQAVRTDVARELDISPRLVDVESDVTQSLEEVGPRATDPSLGLQREFTVDLDPAAQRELVAREFEGVEAEDVELDEEKGVGIVTQEAQEPEGVVDRLLEPRAVQEVGLEFDAEQVVDPVAETAVGERLVDIGAEARERIGEGRERLEAGQEFVTERGSEAVDLGVEVGQGVSERLAEAENTLLFGVDTQEESLGDDVVIGEVPIGGPAPARGARAARFARDLGGIRDVAIGAGVLGGAAAADTARRRQGEVPVTEVDRAEIPVVERRPEEIPAIDRDITEVPATEVDRTELPVSDPTVTSPGVLETGAVIDQPQPGQITEEDELLTPPGPTIDEPDPTTVDEGDVVIDQPVIDDRADPTVIDEPTIEESVLEDVTEPTIGQPGDLETGFEDATPGGSDPENTFRRGPEVAIPEDPSIDTESIIQPTVDQRSDVGVSEFIDGTAQPEIRIDALEGSFADPMARPTAGPITGVLTEPVTEPRLEPAPDVTIDPIASGLIDPVGQPLANPLATPTATSTRPTRPTEPVIPPLPDIELPEGDTDRRRRRDPGEFTRRLEFDIGDPLDIDLGLDP